MSCMNHLSQKSKITMHNLLTSHSIYCSTSNSLSTCRRGWLGFTGFSNQWCQPRRLRDLRLWVPGQLPSVKNSCLTLMSYNCLQCMVENPLGSNRWNLPLYYRQYGTLVFPYLYCNGCIIVPPMLSYVASVMFLSSVQKAWMLQVILIVNPQWIWEN
jgi:hypothetical protein